MLKTLAVTCLLVTFGAAGCRKPKTRQVAPSLGADTVAPPPFRSPPVLAGTPDVATLVQKVRPAVVNITVEEFLKLPRGHFPAPFDFFPWQHENGLGRPDQGAILRQQAEGSGFIIDAQGHVVTNAHVVEGASIVRVRLLDGRSYEAHVKGIDRRLDVAVLAMDGAKDLPVAVLGSSAALRVGQYVIAIGNPFGLGNTVTMGIVSAKSRSIGEGPYDDFVQTDASINPGNSGGPLFDLEGQVVGINTAIDPHGQGIGFAIPVDALREVLPQLLTIGHVERGMLGVFVQPMGWTLAKALGLDRPHGALVADVDADGPAARAGVQPGDVILSVAGTPIASSNALPRTVATHFPGSDVKVEVLRGSQTKTFDVKLGELKEPRESAEERASRFQVPRNPPHLGIEAGDAPGGGALVRHVVPGSPADGVLVPGDVVVAIDHAPVRTAADLNRDIRPSARPLLFEVKHGAARRFVALPSK